MVVWKVPTFPFHVLQIMILSVQKQIRYFTLVFWQTNKTKTMFIQMIQSPYKMIYKLIMLSEKQQIWEIWLSAKNLTHSKSMGIWIT